MVEDFCNYDFHDAVIEKIEINSNKTILHIDADGRKVRIICNDTAGVTDICMWEDDIIFDVNISHVKGVLNPFLQNIRKAHGSDSPICEGLLDLSVELTNNIVFHIYCYGVDVETEFPDELDGTKVLCYAELETPETLYYTEGEFWCKIYYYAICKYENDGGYCLFGCTEDFSVETDSLWESAEECKNTLNNPNLTWISK